MYTIYNISNDILSQIVSRTLTRNQIDDLLIPYLYNTEKHADGTLIVKVHKRVVDETLDYDYDDPCLDLEYIEVIDNYYKKDSTWFFDDAGTIKPCIPPKRVIDALNSCISKITIDDWNAYNTTGACDAMSYFRFIDKGCPKEIPTKICDLIDLDKLICSYNQLRELPTEIGNLINLQDFSCWNNQLKGLPT